MATRASTEPAPAAAIETDGGGSLATVAPLRIPKAVDHSPAVAQPGELRARMLRRLLLAGDIVALCAAFFLVQLSAGDLAPHNLALLILSLPLWLLLAYGHRLYHLDSYRADYSAADEIGPVLQMATLWSWTVLLALAVVKPDNVAVSKIALFWLLTMVLTLALRSAARSIARRRVWYLQNALIIGPENQAIAILQKMLRHPEWGINVVACVAGPGARFKPSGTNRLMDFVPVLEGDVDIPELVRRLDVDRVMLTPAMSESRGRVEVVWELSELGIHVDLVPSWSDVVGTRFEVNQMEGMPVLTMPRPRLARSSLRMKRALDLVLGTLATIVLAPVLAACAIAIKLDAPGPVFFRQRRIGRDDRPFEVYKFRSMQADADRNKDAVATLNFHGGGNDNGMFKIREDPRVTRVGRFLRRYSLDELPQLFNILRGEMSFVGPRPLIETEDRQIEGRFRRRLSLTPGLTGLWQAHGRSDIPFEQMVNLDFLYVSNWSLWLDVKLLIRTASAVFRGTGAY
jgi:exopolysaccharide biosynthesis polyprenyl glycosylphosphotransferase